MKIQDTEETPDAPEESSRVEPQQPERKIGFFYGLRYDQPEETPAVVTAKDQEAGKGGKKTSAVSAKSQKKCSDKKLLKGCRGENVREMQNKLINLGYPLPKKGADGIFGPETQGALIQFQKDNNLNSNGIADENTLNKLDSAPSKTLKKASSTKTASSSPEEPEPGRSSASQEYVPDALGIQQTFWLARELFGDMGVSKEDMTQVVTVFDRVIKRMRTEGDIITAKEVRKAVDEVKSQYPDLFSGGITENLQKEYYLNPIKDRYNKIENLVFERLVKNAN